MKNTPIASAQNTHQRTSRVLAHHHTHAGIELPFKNEGITMLPQNMEEVRRAQEGSGQACGFSDCYLLCCMRGGHQQKTILLPQAM